MINIFQNNKKKSYTELHITFRNKYVICYNVSPNNEDNILITYYFKPVYYWETPISDYELLFNKDIRKVINKFLRIPNNKIIHDSLDDSNRLVLTHISNRAELEIIISSVKRELRNKLNGNI